MVRAGFYVVRMLQFRVGITLLVVMLVIMTRAIIRLAGQEATSPTARVGVRPRSPGRDKGEGK